MSRRRPQEPRLMPRPPPVPQHAAPEPSPVVRVVQEQVQRPENRALDRAGHGRPADESLELVPLFQRGGEVVEVLVRWAAPILIPPHEPAPGPPSPSEREPRGLNGRTLAPASRKMISASWPVAAARWKPSMSLRSSAGSGVPGG